MSSSITTDSRCRQQFLEQEALLPRSFVWLLRYFSFLLDVPTHRLYAELQQVETCVIFSWKKLQREGGGETTGGQFPSLGPCRTDTKVEGAVNRRVSTKQKANLSRKRKFVCNFPDCKKTFFKKFHLNSHLNTHKGVCVCARVC